MKAFEASTRIEASPETVWSIITDGAGYMQWKSGVEQLEGTIAPGEKLKVKWEGTDRVFPVKVTEFTPPRSMHWVGGVPLGLFKGDRAFTLSPVGEGATDFHLREEYTGPLTAVIWKSMPDLGPAFEGFVRGLKARAEGAG